MMQKGSPNFHLLIFKMFKCDMVKRGEKNLKCGGIIQVQNVLNT